MRTRLLALFLLLTAPALAEPTRPVIPAVPKDQAEGDISVTLQKAIDLAGSMETGGVVWVGPGAWETLPIRLKSNVTLRLDKGAVLKFAFKPEAHEIVRTRWEGTECWNLAALIHADGAKNIAIEGQGTLDGNGKPWMDWARKQGPAQKKLRELGNAGTKPEARRFGVGDFLRPNFITLARCEGIRIEGVTIQNSPMWIVHPLESKDIVVRGVNISSTGANTDGIDPESCRNVLIEKCVIDSGDDCIAIKSGRDADGRRTNLPTEDVTIKDCRMLRGHAGVAIGSESSGSIRRVTVKDCTFEGTGRGIRMKTQRGRGGVIEDVTWDGIRMTRIGGEAIILTLRYNPVPKEDLGERTPAMRNVTLRNVTCEGAKAAVVIEGLEERPIENVAFKDVTISASTGLRASHAKGVTLENVKLTPAEMKWENCAGVLIDGKPAK